MGIRGFSKPVFSTVVGFLIQILSKKIEVEVSEG